MSRKDYTALVKDLRLEMPKNATEESGYRLAISVFADALKRNNPRFDYDRFYEALNA